MRREPARRLSGTSAKAVRRAARRATDHERDDNGRARNCSGVWRKGRPCASGGNKPRLPAPQSRDSGRRRATPIINSKSGPNHDSILHVRDLVEMLASFGIRVDVRVKLRKSQTRKEARAAAIKGRYGLIIAAGGDGTVEAVASGLVGTKATLGIVPLGTYNNIATCLGIPTDVGQACALIACGAPRRIDVGQVIARHMKRPRIFLELSTVGLGAALGPLGQHVEKGAGTRPRRRCQASWICRRHQRGCCSTTKRVATPQTACSSPFQIPHEPAGCRLLRPARMDDGLLDVCIYEDMNQPALLARFLPDPLAVPPAHKTIKCCALALGRSRFTPPPHASVHRIEACRRDASTVHSTGRALSVIVGDGSALQHPLSMELVRASASAAHTLALFPQTNGTGGGPQKLVRPSSSGLLQLLVPVAGRTLDAAAAARPVLLPLFVGALGVAAASLWRPATKRLLR